MERASSAACTRPLDPCSVMQLDVTATPRHSKGALFTWTIYDYPLKQAILDNIVKRPSRAWPPASRKRPPTSPASAIEAYLTAGVERWREYREQLAPLGKKPLLFVMMNDTTEADDVGDYLRVKYPAEFGGDKLLIIHTDKSGEVSQEGPGRGPRRRPARWTTPTAPSTPSSAS